MHYTAALFNLIVQDWINSGFVDEKGGDPENLLGGNKPLRKRDEAELEQMVFDAYEEEMKDGGEHTPFSSGERKFREWVLRKAKAMQNWYDIVWFGAE